MTKEKPQPQVQQNPVLWDAAMMTLATYKKKRIDPLDAMLDVERTAKPRRPRRIRDVAPNPTEQGRDDH